MLLTSFRALSPLLNRSSGSRAQTNAIIATLAYCGVAGAFMHTLVLPLIVQFPRILQTTPSAASWILTSTLLAAAVTTPISGRLGDMYGKRRVLIGCLIFLIVGSTICALSSSLGPVVLGRTLQGAATSVIPLGISILRDEVPRERITSSIALISATLAVGDAVGLPISALLVQYFDWHILFWGAAFIGVVGLVLIVFLVPESPIINSGKFDVVGAFGLAVGLLCLLIALTKCHDWGLSSSRIFILFLISVIILSAWVWHERRTDVPMVDIRVSSSRPVLLTNISSVMAGFAMYAMYITLPQLLQMPRSTGYGLGQSTFVAGLCLLPCGLMMMAISPAAARLSDRSGPKIALLSGLGIIAASYITALFLMQTSWQIVFVGIINGAGVGLAYAAMPMLIIAAVPLHQTAAANGLNALMRAIGMSFSGALMALMLDTMTITVESGTFPTKMSFHLAFIIGAVAALLAMAVGALIPRSPRVTAEPLQSGKKVFIKFLDEPDD